MFREYYRKKMAQARGETPSDYGKSVPSPKATSNDRETPVSPKVAPGQPETPVSPKASPGEPERPVSPKASPGQPETPVSPKASPGQPETPVSPKASPGEPERLVSPKAAPGQPERTISLKPTLNDYRRPIIGRGDTMADPYKTSAGEKKERKSVISMVPLLSWRSIIFMAIGLIVGVGGGLGYWIVSPSLSASSLPIESNTEAGGLAGVIGMPETHTGPFESSIIIQVVHPDSSYISLKDLQRMGEYYAAVANSLPFLRFMSEELAEKAPEYSHTVSELDHIIVARYDWDNELPSIEMKVTVSSTEEALFLPGFVAESFQSYLVAEENEKQLQEYQDTLAEIEVVKAALSEAEGELANLTLEGAPYGTNDDPELIRLKAEIASLEFRLGQLTTQQAALVAGGSNTQNPVEIENISKALAEAYRKLSVLEAESTIQYSEKNLDYKIAKAKVDTLNVQLADLTAKLSSSLGSNMEVPEIANYLVMGNSSIPVPILPERVRARNALIMGAIVGIGGAFVILNYKWIAKGMPSSASTPPEGEDEA